MKNTLKLFALVAFIFAAFAATAQTAKPIKLGHLDVQKVMTSMPEFKKAQQDLEAKEAEIRKELTSMHESYQKLAQEYQANAKTYTELTRTAKEQEIQGLMQRIEQFQSLAQEQMAKTQEDLLTPIITKIQNAVQAVGKEGGFTYIFAATPNFGQGALLYTADNSEDILPLVKKKLGIQ
ncbi:MULTISPECIES: OmpH family outer membrane protein [Odoribacteraceae]|uniref:OmpH family outer membrane protein n=1 Tax=Odoribacteraceae TaxID=1853231 RepID=UPI000E51A100|nr:MULTISPECIES: OmpH family outer membrane protein [Odoribacteraceae]MCQ4874737.1 OmpH family outer membrane protein [Butyricimonas paravirosa]RHR80490.1 OmpH family outer membrane protein [Odoribacter sp. AF15-53]